MIFYLVCKDLGTWLFCFSWHGKLSHDCETCTKQQTTKTSTVSVIEQNFSEKLQTKHFTSDLDVEKSALQCTVVGLVCRSEYLKSWGLFYCSKETSLTWRIKLQQQCSGGGFELWSREGMNTQIGIIMMQCLSIWDNSWF